MILGLGPEEVDDDELDDIPANEEDVEVVVQVLECGTGGVLDDGGSAGREELRKCLAFARVLISRHSTTYMGDSGVQADEKMMPKR